MIHGVWTIEPASASAFPAAFCGVGERILAGTDEQEMLFTFPAKELEMLAGGLEKTHKKGTRYPIQSYMIYQPPVIPPVKALEEKLVDN